MPMARTISITLRIFSGIPFLAGSAAFAWGIFCFLGGPEGRPWSAAALIAWSISWTVAAACAGFYLLLNRAAARARLVLLIAWTGLSGLFALFALTAAALKGVPEMIPAAAVLMVAACAAGVVACRLARRR